MVISSEKVALQVIQQAIAVLAKWADPNNPLTSQLNSVEEYPEVSRAKKILGWTKDAEVGILRLLFDRVNLSDKPKQEPSELHYHPLVVIENENKEYPDIPYPLNYEPRKEQEAFKEKIKKEVLPILNNNWKHLYFLMLVLEKFGSSLSFGESDVALVDIARSTAAVAAVLVNNPTENISLIAGDLSGIRKNSGLISRKQGWARQIIIRISQQCLCKKVNHRPTLTTTGLHYSQQMGSVFKPLH